jgi:hypothetical protein
MSFEPGYPYLTRCGEVVRVDDRCGPRLFGKGFKRRIDLCWHVDGAQSPRGGTGPYDLIRPHHNIEEKASE